MLHLTAPLAAALGLALALGSPALGAVFVVDSTADEIDASPDDLGAAFARYGKRRKPSTDALAQLALDNFIEMRDTVASPAFRRKKRIEHALAAALLGAGIVFWIARRAWRRARAKPA